MSRDVLTAVLQAVRIAGSLQFCVVASGDWQTDGTPRLAKATRSSARLVPFHIVAEGSCWLRLEGREVTLDRGDVVAFPFGTGHALGFGQAGRLIIPTEDLPPRPWNDTPVLRYGAGPVSARLLCGYVAFDVLNFRPLQRSLPSLLVARALAPGARPLLQGAVQHMIAEADSNGVGAPAVLERLTEIILIELLRSETASRQQSAAGLLAAMSDAILGRCLAAIHAEPERPWSVASLARQCGSSRTVLDQRFQEFLETSPMRYVREWRLYLASVQLRNTSKPIGAIAGEAGYGTEAAFNRAFARVHGMPPARWRVHSRLS